MDNDTLDPACSAEGLTNVNDIDLPDCIRNAPKGPYLPPHETRARNDAIAEMYRRRQVGIKKVAKFFGVSKTQARRVLEVYDVPIAPVGRPRNEVDEAWEREIKVAKRGAARGV